MSDNIITLNSELIHTELKDLVRNSVEETLNSLLDAEADRLVNAERYARDEERQGYRSGHYDRNFTTTSGDVNLRVPKLKGLTFETAIIERYKRRETSVEEALIEMYLAGVSVRRVEDITEALWGTKVSPGTISNLNKKAYENIEKWRNRSLDGETYPYVYVDGIFLKRSWGGEFENVSVLVAVGVSSDGHREILGAAEGLKEDLESWKNFFVWLKSRGLSGVRLVIGDKALGMVEAIGQVFPKAKYQRCIVHFYRNVFSVVPNGLEAVEFYKEAFGAEVIRCSTFGQVIPSTPEELKNYVMNAQLRIGSIRLQLSDNSPEYDYVQGTNMSACLQFEIVEEAKKVFDKLKVGAQSVSLDFAEVPWSPGYGNLVDRFGMAWQVNTDIAGFVSETVKF